MDEAAAHKFNPHHDELGRFTFSPNNGDDGSERPQPASRRRAGARQGTPAQEARHAIAEARAREAVQRLRELEPNWTGPESLSDPDSIEGRIGHLEATAQAAEARLAEILRDAIPNTNPSWGVNRLVKELHEQGYVLKEPTKRSPGLMYHNEETGEEVRIMERPTRSYSTDSPQKHFNDFYYRYKTPGRGWGAHITIPNK